MTNRRISLKTVALSGCALAALIAGPAAAEQFSVQAQDLKPALQQFATQGDQQVLFSSAAVAGKRSAGFTGDAAPETALAQLLAGTDMTFRKNGDTYLIVSASDPQSRSAAGDGADQGTVAALVVTAQKKEEQIQDVPIAISAFTEKSLEEQKIEGGFDLLKAIPNVTFSKNNFTSYNFSIRGIGTKAVSATTDPGVAVSFNNIALIQNRLFEQEYFDVERVEVLRGPQGTLYGRNATAGVINVISAKPNLHEFSGWLKGEVGNYHAKRLSAMVNVPLIEDKLAIRFAGSLTNRQGYDYNDVTKHAVNGRDLWSGRITIAFDPTDNVHTNLVWERFNEDDNRSRTGKQLCHRDDGPTSVGGVSTANPIDPYLGLQARGVFSQVCLPGSLYDPGAFGTPNGFALPFIYGPLMYAVIFPLGLRDPLSPENSLDWRNRQGLIQRVDPYAGMTQSPNLREISSFKDPIYHAKADVVELNIDFNLTPHLTISSQTAYDKDSIYSFQDYNRFNTRPVFTNTASLYALSLGRPTDPSPYANVAPGGVFCDPQLGCSNTIAGFDISKAKGAQFTQELRVQSNFAGPLNFALGANYTRFSVIADYYVMFNLMTALSSVPPLSLPHLGNLPQPTNWDPGKCYMGADFNFFWDGISLDDPRSGCIYIDPNPLERINGEGHNYFRSKNPYHLKSGAAFGEVYWQPMEAVKITAGLRYTDDRKRFIPVPSQLLLSSFYTNLGTVSRGYPELPSIKQRWGEVTGRLGVDWKPELSFTDETMIYAFYSRGYKGGGANPPGIGYGGLLGTPYASGLPKDYGDTFKPEFVNALEIGTKNTLMGGAAIANASAFYYDYEDYQVSEILDRMAVNSNYDAKVWGVEFEGLLQPSRNLRLNGNIGYLNSAIASGEKSVDVMNRTQGDPNYVVFRPWVQFPSNCVVPTAVAAAWFAGNSPEAPIGGFQTVCLSRPGSPAGQIADPTLGGLYDPANYPKLNNGRGLYADLGGNKLPNAPHWTVNVGAQYGVDFLDGWRATLRSDAYWQSQSWARVYNAVNDKLHGWYNVNLSVWVERPEDGLKIELYAKNILDKSPITDAFLNSDDTGLTTNVFTLDPRLIGLSIKKDF